MIAAVYSKQGSLASIRAQKMLQVIEVKRKIGSTCKSAADYTSN